MDGKILHVYFKFNNKKMFKTHASGLDHCLDVIEHKKKKKKKKKNLVKF